MSYTRPICYQPVEQSRILRPTKYRRASFYEAAANFDTRQSQYCDRVMHMAQSDPNGSSPRTLTVTITSCVDDVLALRNAAYSTRDYNVRNIETMADEFDERSEHVTLWDGSAAIATARLTSGPDGVFEQWSRGKAKIPTGSHVADISRVAVRPDVRRLGLSSFVILECLRRAAERHFQVVVGATTREGALYDFLRRTGFVEAGSAVELLESQGQRITVQPMAVLVSPHLVRIWREMQEESQRRLAINGCSLRRDIQR
jgi:predicted GNAT family N-acyltransferase